MQAAKGTVGHHVRVLREAGIVRLAGTRHVRGGTEQTLALVSRGFRRCSRPGQAEHTPPLGGEPYGLPLSLYPADIPAPPPRPSGESAARNTAS
nr:transcriptional regulator [Microbispora rosea]